MAYIPTRLRCEFTSMDGTCHSVLICDTDYAGFPVDFDTDEVGYTISYENENGKIYEGMHASECTVNLRVTDTNESAFQTFLTDLVASQESEFFVKVLKGSNESGVPADIWDEFFYEVYADGSWTVEDMSCSGQTSSWKGQVVQDLVEYEDLPNPYTFSIVANDALTKLKGIEISDRTTKSFLEFFIDIMSDTGINALWANNEPFLTTSVRWFEDNMNGASTTNCDPFAFSRFDPEEVFFRVEDNGEFEYPDLFERFQKNLIEIWNARVYQANGKWWIVQNDQLPNETITTFTYAKNYTATNPTSVSAGLIEQEGSEALTKTAIKNSNGKVSPTPLTGNIYRFYPALQGARALFEFLQSAVLYDQVQQDFTTNTQLATVTTGTNLTLFIELNHLVAYSSIPSTVLERAYLRSDFTIKIVNGGVTQYLVNTGPIVQWQTAAGVYRLEDTITLQSGRGSSSVAAQFITGLIPQSGSLEISVSTTLVGKSSGTSFTSNIDTERTDLKVTYYDQVDEIEGEIEYTSDNANASASSVVADLGTYQIGDLPSSPEKNRIEIYNADWVAATDWQRELAGTKYSIHELHTLEVAAMQRSPFREYKGTFKYGGLEFYNLISYDGIIYALTGGEYIARMEEWRGSYFQVARTTTSITVLDNRNNITRGFSDIINRAPQPDQTIDAGLGDRLKFTDTTADLTGTITSLSVAALSSGAKTIRQGDTITLLDPNDGTKQELIVDADSNAGATSISVASTVLSHDFPTGTYVMFEGDKLLQKIGSPDVVGESASGILTNSSGVYTAIVSASPNIDGYYRVHVAIQVLCETTDNLLLRIHDGTNYVFYPSDFEITGIANTEYPFSITTGTEYFETTDKIRFEYANNEDWQYVNAAIILERVY